MNFVPLFCTCHNYTTLTPSCRIRILFAFVCIHFLRLPVPFISYICFIFKYFPGQFAAEFDLFSAGPTNVFVFVCISLALCVKRCQTSYNDCRIDVDVDVDSTACNRCLPRVGARPRHEPRTKNGPYKQDTRVQVLATAVFP